MFGSISHSFVKDIMFHMKVTDNIIKYITNLYDSLTGFVHSSSWVTSVFPINRGVFQVDTMSPIMFLMALTPVIKMMENINCPGFYFNIPIPKNQDLPHCGTTIQVLWEEDHSKGPKG